MSHPVFSLRRWLSCIALLALLFVLPNLSPAIAQADLIETPAPSTTPLPTATPTPMPTVASRVTNLRAAAETDGVNLTWEYVGEEYSRFEVWRDELTDNPTGGFTFIGQLPAPQAPLPMVMTYLDNTALSGTTYTYLLMCYFHKPHLPKTCGFMRVWFCPTCLRHWLPAVMRQR